MNEKNVCFVFIGILKILVINLNHVCNKCHEMTAHELKKHCNTECNYVGYRCILLGISRNQVANILNNSALEDKGVL